MGAFDIKGVILSRPMCRVNLNPLISWTKSDNMGSTPLDRRRAENIEDDHKGAGSGRVSVNKLLNMFYILCIFSDASYSCFCFCFLRFAVNVK